MDQSKQTDSFVGQIVIGDPTSLDEGTIPFNKTYNAMFNSTGQINGHYPIQIDSIDVYGQTPYNNGTTPITQSDLAGQSVVIDTGYASSCYSPALGYISDVSQLEYYICSQSSP